jgi:RimJ/RimL family protein N-acetyltransferase
MSQSLPHHTSAADGHGPQWAGAVADLADRAGAAFDTAVQGCLTVLDLEPWRRQDAAWLCARLNSLARLSGRPVRYAPCLGPGYPPQGQQAQTPAGAWSTGAEPVALSWPAHKALPHATKSGRAWLPDGPVLIVAGELPQRLPQDLLLSHHGEIKLWGGEPAAQQWQTIDATRHSAWVTDSLQAYARGLPSSMLSLPLGYWRFLEKAVAWATHGVLVLARAQGWSNLAQIREDAVTRADVSADTPPVNFHWLAQQAPRLGATAYTVRDSRSDTVQLLAAGLPGCGALLPLMAEPLRAATQSSRGDRARAVRLLATSGDLPAAMSILDMSAPDPALLRAAWDALATCASTASIGATTQLGIWLEQVMDSTPWTSADTALLRATGHVALACARVDLAHGALQALRGQGLALAADLAALARCEEQLGNIDAALAACDTALLHHPGHEEARITRERCAARQATLLAPWRVQHGHAGAPLMLDPLHTDHAPALFRQMRDPSIAVMTALPHFAEGDDGRAWIQARLDDGPAAFAIVHRQLGLVGYLDLRVWQTTAFICYWIGADYQGRGFCAPAIALGLEMAWRNGIDLLLSSAYDDNMRSLRSLRKSGFSTMTKRAAAPDSDRTFVMLPAPGFDAAQAPQRLIDFCANTGSGLRFDAAPDEVPHEAADSAAALLAAMTPPDTHGAASACAQH